MSSILMRKGDSITQDKSEEKGRWVTTKTGKKLHLNENGEPDKGNPKVLKAAKGKADKGGSKKSEAKGGGKADNKNQKKEREEKVKEWQKERDRPKTKEEAEKIINKVLSPGSEYWQNKTFLSGPGSVHGGTISWQDKPGMFDDKSKFKAGWHDWHGNYLSEEQVLDLVKGGGWGFGYS